MVSYLSFKGVEVPWAFIYSTSSGLMPAYYLKNGKNKERRKYR